MLVFTRLTRKMVLPVVLALAILAAIGFPAESKPIQVGNRFNSHSVRGHSGGAINSGDCGFISQQPSQVINVTQRVNYMQVRVIASGGKPTLLIRGANRRFCSIADDVSGVNPQISGVWLPGRYLIYVGDRTRTRHPFTLTISK